MRIFFARHGESTANLLHVFSNRALDHPLTEKGRAQAADLARRLTDEGITRVCASPVPRAVETAHIIAAMLDVEVYYSEALREFDVGVFEGRCDANAWQEFSELLKRWLTLGLLDEKIPGGESYVDVQARFVPYIEALVAEFGHTKENILVISHGGLYLLMLPEVLGNLPRAYMNEHRLGYTEIVVAEYIEGQLIASEFAGEQLRSS